MSDPETAPKIPKVLVVDDDAIIRTLLAFMLEPLGVEILTASCGQSGLDTARRESPDLVLLDNEMPGMNGLDVLRRLKADPTLAEIPVIFVTGSDSKSVLTECFQSGAADYVHKPCCEAELHARVRAALENRRLVGELQWLATHDRLTGLPNRALILQRIQKSIARAAQEPEFLFAVLFMDFDRFKLINDSMGHEIGDQFLREIAVRLEHSLRDPSLTGPNAGQHVAARLGGDEFVVLLDGVTSASEAREIADRLLDAVCGRYVMGAADLVSTASLGLLTSSPNYTTAEEMLRDADTAMYEAKGAGRGRCTTFDATMQLRIRERVSLENDLRRALARSEFSLAYQPIVSLRTGATETLEALLRWRHPTRGPLSPADFIPVAEDTGLIIPLGRWALSEACRQLAEWRYRHPHTRQVGVSVNLSRKQLGNSALASDVAQILAENGLPADALHLEVTESEVMHDQVAATARLKELRDLGIQLDIDDFGTGHSSLACLHRFPISFLKIDRSFVSSITRTHVFAALVHAIAQLARNLGVKVVAEGIETEEQLALLQSLECDFGQGYLLAKPLPAWQVPEFLSLPRAFPARPAAEATTPPVFGPSELAGLVSR